MSFIESMREKARDKMCEFEKNQYGTNELLDLGKYGYISYNVAPARNIPMFQSDGLSDETAIRLTREDGSHVWLILNGDFREEYKEAAKKGMKAVLEVYNRQWIIQQRHRRQR